MRSRTSAGPASANRNAILSARPSAFGEKAARVAVTPPRVRVTLSCVEAVVEATDAIATSRLAVPFGSDTRRPQVKIVQRFPLRVWVSEPSRLTLRFGARSLVYEATAPGTARIRNAPRLGIVRAVAWDAAGNTSIPKSKR